MEGLRQGRSLLVARQGALLLPASGRVYWAPNNLFFASGGRGRRTYGICTGCMGEGPYTHECAKGCTENHVRAGRRTQQQVANHEQVEGDRPGVPSVPCRYKRPRTPQGKELDTRLVALLCTDEERVVVEPGMRQVPNLPVDATRFDFEEDCPYWESMKMHCREMFNIRLDRLRPGDHLPDDAFGTHDD